MKINTNRFQSSALNCAMDLCKRIRDYGHEAYIVGGSVRDMVRVELGQTAISDRLKAEGYEPGPVFGDILRGQIEKIYQDAVNRM